MGAVLGEPWQFMEMADIMAQWEPDNRDIQNGRMHCSDLTMIHRMFIELSRDRPPWFVMEPGSPVYGQPGWQESSLVHYGYEMRADGHWPKCDHIEKLRPI